MPPGKDLKEFRCTRNQPYLAPGCPGNNYYTGRQGHYVFARTPLGAALQMISSWPDDIVHGFIIQERGTDRVFSWTARTGLVLYRVSRDHIGADLPRDNVHCHEEPHHPTLDPSLILERAAAQIDADRTIADELEAWRNLRIKLKREGEEKKREEHQASLRQAELERKTAPVGDGETIAVQGTVDMTAYFTKYVVADVPIELLEEYKQNVENGPCDDVMNRMNDIFINKAMEEPLEEIGGVNGWSLEEYESIIVEWKTPEE